MIEPTAHPNAIGFRDDSFPKHLVRAVAGIFLVSLDSVLYCPNLSAQSSSEPKDCPVEVFAENVLISCRDVTPDGFKDESHRVLLARVGFKTIFRSEEKVVDRIEHRLLFPLGHKVIDMLPRMESDDVGAGAKGQELCVALAEDGTTARFDFNQRTQDGSVPATETFPELGGFRHQAIFGVWPHRWGIPGDFNAEKQRRQIWFSLKTHDNKPGSRLTALLVLLQVPSDWRDSRVEWDSRLYRTEEGKDVRVAAVGKALGFYESGSEEAVESVKRLVPPFTRIDARSFPSQADEATKANWKKYCGSYRYDAWLANIFVDIDLDADGMFTAAIRGPMWSWKASGIWTADNGRLVACSWNNSGATECEWVQLINEDIKSFDTKKGTLRTARWVLKRRSN